MTEPDAIDLDAVAWDSSPVRVELVDAADVTWPAADPFPWEVLVTWTADGRVIWEVRDRVAG